MHPKKKEEIIQQLIQIACEVKSPALAEETYALKEFHGEEGEFKLFEPSIRQYTELGNSLLTEEDWGSKFSEDYIYNALDKILAKTVKDPHKYTVEPLVDQLLHDLSSYSDELTVYLPVSGLGMDVDALEIGNIVLRKATEQFIDELSARIGSFISSVTNPESDKDFWRISERKDLERYKNHTFAEFHVIAETKRAVERAVDECRRVLDLFWFLVPISNSGDSRFYISIEYIGPREASILCEKKFYTRDSRTCFLPFHLRGELLGAMREIGMFEISNLFKKADHALTEFERTLLRGIHWYAAARAQTESENEFLNLVVSLETFLTPKDREPIGTYLAEGLAIILGENLQQRIEIKEKVKKLYRMRSGISHGGQKAIADTDLIWLRTAVWYLTEWMIQHRNQFRSLHDLQNWIEEKKLGVG